MPASVINFIVLLLVSDKAALVGELACLLLVYLLHIRAACETDYFVRASIDAAHR